MSKWKRVFVSGLAVLAMALIVACGSNGGGAAPTSFSTPAGAVVIFGTDAPICDVESFLATITSASLVPQSGGNSVPLITSTTPATVDFARLTDFTNILSTASVTPGTYNQLQMTLTNPQLFVLNTSTSPPTPQAVPATLTATSFTITISPALVVTSTTTSGLMMDFNLRKSLQVDGTGQVTGTVDPQITVAATTTSGATVGEADSLYGIVQSLSTTNPPSGFTGSFGLAVHDGTGQTLTILANSNTVFEGDGVTSFSDLTAETFVEVDAIVNTSGQIIAQTVDAEEQTSYRQTRSRRSWERSSTSRVTLPATPPPSPCSSMMKSLISAARFRSIQDSMSLWRAPPITLPTGNIGIARTSPSAPRRWVWRKRLLYSVLSERAHRRQ